MGNAERHRIEKEEFDFSKALKGVPPSVFTEIPRGLSNTSRLHVDLIHYEEVFELLVKLDPNQIDRIVLQMTRVVGYVFEVKVFFKNAQFDLRITTRLSLSDASAIKKTITHLLAGFYLAGLEDKVAIPGKDLFDEGPVKAFYKLIRHYERRKGDTDKFNVLQGEIAPLARFAKKVLSRAHALRDNGRFPDTIALTEEWKFYLDLKLYESI